jgi:hypothetical protein
MLLTGVTLLPKVPLAADALSDSAKSLSGLLHTHEEFEFVANASINTTWPLFGAKKERAWAPGWAPVFLWPENSTDQHGTIFQIAHGDKTAIWLTTFYDQRNKNRVQYAYVIPDVVATIITLKLTPQGRSTHVAVTYERTALSVSANETVSKMAARDKLSGPEWGQQVNDYLRQ